MDNSTIFSELLNEPLNELVYEKQKPNNNSPTAVLGADTMANGTETVNKEPLKQLLNEKQKPYISPTTDLGCGYNGHLKETFKEKYFTEEKHLKEKHLKEKRQKIKLKAKLKERSTPREKLKEKLKEKHFTEKKPKEKLREKPKRSENATTPVIDANKSDTWLPSVPKATNLTGRPVTKRKGNSTPMSQL
ncbi:hypothetical protein SNE40_004015 [Patella caerulea]